MTEPEYFKELKEKTSAQALERLAGDEIETFFLQATQHKVSQLMK